MQAGRIDRGLAAQFKFAVSTSEISLINSDTSKHLDPAEGLAEISLKLHFSAEVFKEVSVLTGGMSGLKKNNESKSVGTDL